MVPTFIKPSMTGNIIEYIDGSGIHLVETEGRECRSERNMDMNRGGKGALIALLLLALALSGCAGKKPPPAPPDVDRRPPGIEKAKPGKEKRWRQEGIASWYGKKYHRRKTASGERYNMYELTAAHRTLPFGTILKVTNLENGRTVKVRINDRGPFVKGRIIDLSLAAAREIGMVQAGIVRVRIVMVKKS